MANLINAREETTDRDGMLAILSDRVDFVDRRVESLVNADEVSEETLIKWLRLQAQLVGQYRQLLKDAHIDDIQDDLELLKEVTNLEGDE